MWKAVIADDEGVILQGLKKLVDWTNMDVHLVGEARDGQQLKEVMEETDPDIVITDIMMPYRTGLDILRWCNEADMHATCSTQGSGGCGAQGNSKTGRTEYH